MTIVDRFGGDRKGIQGDLSSVGYKSKAKGSLSRALTTTTQSMMLLPIKVSVLSPNCVGDDQVAKVSDVCLWVDGFMEATSKELQESYSLIGFDVVFLVHRVSCVEG